MGELRGLCITLSNTNQIIGVDPWDRSIAESEAARLGSNFRVSDYLPDALPVDEKVFDLAYAFSVFTHLSERATVSALRAIRRYMRPDALLCITIRSIEYWDFETAALLPVARERLKAQHDSAGFTFSPHNRSAIDGDVTYGDTTMSFAWLDQHSVGWKRIGIDRSLENPFQIYVFLEAC